VLRSGRPALVDYKSTVCAERWAFAKSAYNFGYFEQSDWYLAAPMVDPEAAFLFVAQETRPPYLVAVYQSTAAALRYGRVRNDLACETFAECVATDTWPGYSSDVEQISLPPWAERDYL
jgi:hypothetical protein